jgi:hypothetical protein
MLWVNPPLRICIQAGYCSDKTLIFCFGSYRVLIWVGLPANITGFPLALSTHMLGHQAPFNRAFFTMARHPLVGQVFLFVEASRSHSDTLYLVGLMWTSDQPAAETSAWQHTTLTRDGGIMLPVGFEPAIAASERMQTHALGRVTTGVAQRLLYSTLVTSESLLGLFDTIENFHSTLYKTWIWHNVLK